MPDLNWKEEIVKLVYVKQAIAEVDRGRLYTHHLPKIAATNAQIHAAERALEFALPNDYVAFLLCADGWDGFLQNTDLFGTPDLCGSHRYQAALESIDMYDDNVFANIGVAKDDLFPIGYSPLDGNLYMMVKPNAQTVSDVLWLEGGERERYPTFSEFFLAIVDFNRLVLQIVSDPQQATGADSTNS
jgi:SMI1/KNR4 family protein SUKH-1